jgi:hypothetical protein
MNSMKVSIQKPCSESWEQMDDLGQSRFCASCQKCVTDFTQMSDRDIVQILQNQSGEICGRFNESQLERDLFALELKQNKYLNAFFSMTLLSAMGLPQKTQARALPPTTFVKSQKDSLPTPKNQLLAAKDSTLLGGIVQNAETGKPIVGATVTLDDTNVGAKTDENGQFEFRVANTLLRSNHILNIFAMDYNFKIMDLSTIPIDKPIAITLTDVPVVCHSTMPMVKSNMVLGGLTMVAPKVIESTLGSRVKFFFKRIFN